jgi:hypothetical protein
LIQKRVGNTLELVGIGKNFLNETPAAQQLRDSIDKRDLIKLKSFCSSKGTCTPMFITALFTIAKLWKQPRCSTTDEWIKKMWYLYTMEFYAAVKKNEMLSFAVNGWNWRTSF